MANTFTEYFENIRKIMREWGAWYRILTVMILTVIYHIGYAILFPSDAAGKITIPTDINVPLLLLVILCAILVSGYVLQVYSNRMNNYNNLMPKIDFLKMFVCGIKAIPFYIVWSLYFALTFIVLGIICGILGSVISVLRPLFMLIGIIAIIIIIPAWYSIIALFAKDFSYKGNLNPMLLFEMISKTLLRIYAASFASFLGFLALIGVACLLTVPFVKNYMSMPPEALFVLGTIGLILVIYTAQVLSYALKCSIADITREEVDENNLTPTNNDDNSDDDVLNLDEYPFGNDQNERDNGRLDL